uniref:Uncharacterized protein n=1 Tax=Lepeophtheirus salmonis TaxID=72036 RepID=A0A0K2T8S7_LEPSM
MKRRGFTLSARIARSHPSIFFMNAENKGRTQNRTKKRRLADGYAIDNTGLPKGWCRHHERYLHSIVHPNCGLYNTDDRTRVFH